MFAAAQRADHFTGSATHTFFTVNAYDFIHATFTFFNIEYLVLSVRSVKPGSAIDIICSWFQVSRLRSDEIRCGRQISGCKPVIG